MQFSDCHPIVNFMFYIGVLVLGMCLTHPVFLLCSFLFSLSYYWILKRKLWKYLLVMSGLFLMISVLNPVFNTLGDTILFTYLNQRPYTLEALCFGMNMALMFGAILTWFATYNEVMTSDKFLYCFGKMLPAVSLILTMVLRLVPSFQKKTEQIAGARRCIGMSVENGTKREKIEHGMTILSALTSWALEGGVVMADSMRSRGYGCGKRTTFSIYQWKKKDCWLLIMISVCIGMVILCALKGGTEAVFFPKITWSGFDNPWMIFGVIGYFVLLAIPTVLHILEEVIWHILKSRI